MGWAQKKKTKLEPKVLESQEDCHKDHEFQECPSKWTPKPRKSKISLKDEPDPNRGVRLVIPAFRALQSLQKPKNQLKIPPKVDTNPF